MLHVLLLILKITGIVIACILGLVIIVVAAVLFVPVRYKADADYHGKFKAHAKLSWLGILRVLVSYDEELAIKAKALFITIYSNNQKKEKTSHMHISTFALVITYHCLNNLNNCLLLCIIIALHKRIINISLYLFRIVKEYWKT